MTQEEKDFTEHPANKDFFEKRATRFINEITEELARIAAQQDFSYTKEALVNCISKLNLPVSVEYYKDRTQFYKNTGKGLSNQALVLIRNIIYELYKSIDYYIGIRSDKEAFVRKMFEACYMKIVQIAINPPAEPEFTFPKNSPIRMEKSTFLRKVKQLLSKRFLSWGYALSQYKSIIPKDCL